MNEIRARDVTVIHENMAMGDVDVSGEDRTVVIIGFEIPAVNNPNALPWLIADALNAYGDIQADIPSDEGEE